MSSLNFAPFNHAECSYEWTKISGQNNNITINQQNSKGNVKKTVYGWNSLEYPENYTQNMNRSNKNIELDRMIKICSYQNM